MKTIKNKVKVEIDLEPAKRNAEEYAKRKVREAIKTELDDVVMDINYPTIHFPDIEDRLEKLEDWKRDIEQGWIDMCKYCSNCKNRG